MTIARGQMKRQLYQDGTMPEGGLPSLEDIMEGKISPAEMALIRETLEDVEFMQEGYNLDRPGQAMGGLMDTRQAYGFGSLVKSITKPFKKAASKVGDIVKDIDLEDAAAVAAMFTPAAPFVGPTYAAAGGDNPLIQAATMFGQPGGGFGFPGQTPPTVPTGQQFGLADALRAFGGGVTGGRDLEDEKQVYDVDLKKVLETIGKSDDTSAGKPSGFDITKLIKKALKDITGRDVAAGAAGAAVAKLAYEDRKRLIEQVEKDIKQQRADVAMFRERFKNIRGTGRSTGAPTGPADVVVRPGQAMGGIMRGMKKLLDEAYEMASSRSDFDFSDYKMRGQLMAEELAEIKFKKDYYDLDQKTQMDLYQQSSDYLNDVAADMADDMRDMMKERFGKAEGGIMDVPLRTNPQGVTEMDFRETGGFVPPVGIKEKADDIPAMLSNNEFVFTADAVRAAGGGSVNKGAERMYSLMKKLEGQA
jgi:hypothetical protein